MTEETQALVDRLREWVDGQSVTYASVLMEDAATALTSLARDLEKTKESAEVVFLTGKINAEEVQRLRADLAAARQERDAALANCKNWWKLRAELATKQNDTLRAERDAAVRAAHVEGLHEAALVAKRRYAYVLAAEIEQRAIAAREG